MTQNDLTANDVTRDVLANASLVLDQCLEKIHHCFDQLNDEQVWWRPHEDQNSIGNLVLHLTGNVRQWIVSGLGSEDDNRDRPAEFAASHSVSTDVLLRDLGETVERAKSVFNSISPQDMKAQHRIQGFDISGWYALFDCVPHFKGHTQEIICLTRMQLGKHYRFHWQPETPEQGAPTN